jgi:hypothetical protein
MHGVRNDCWLLVTVLWVANPLRIDSEALGNDIVLSLPADRR